MGQAVNLQTTTFDKSGSNECQENEWQERERDQALRVDAGYRKLNLEPSSMRDLDEDDDCSQFLVELERFAELLQAKTATRAYRETFTRKYQCLFNDLGRQYRFLLLQAIVQECPPANINGHVYAFPEKVIELTRKPISYLKELGQSLHLCTSSFYESVCERPLKGEIVNLLGCLDSAWAEFECQYIKQLIHAEALEPLLAAVERANEFCDIPVIGTYSHSQKKGCGYQWKMLVGCISELNVMANIARKGPRDLNERTLNRAMCIVDGSIDATPLAESICRDLVNSFDAMCNYLRSVGYVMETVDATLLNNAGLVERLVELDEAWAMVCSYVSDHRMRASSLDMMYSVVVKTKALEPRFHHMCSDCDAELFLVIPRIAWLNFLLAPYLDSLVKTLLPHLFASSKDKTFRTPLRISKTGECRYDVSGELQSLFDQYEASRQSLSDQLRNDSRGFDTFDVLTRQAVHGPGTDVIDEFIPKGSQEIVRAFMQELERWSFELQRRQARAWNKYCAMVVQHFSHAYKKE